MIPRPLIKSRMNVGDMSVEVTDQDVMINTPGGKRFSILDLLNRVEALETAYMEFKLLGDQPGTIEECKITTTNK